MTRSPCLISGATGARWRPRLIQRLISRNPSVARVQRRIQVRRPLFSQRSVLEPWSSEQRNEILDELIWNAKLCCGATGGYIWRSSNGILLRLSTGRTGDSSLGRRLTLVAKLDILTATSGRTEWRCPRVAERMRELDTESPVVWPAWCYTGESNTWAMMRKKWLTSSLRRLTNGARHHGTMWRFLNENTFCKKKKLVNYCLSDLFN